MPRKPRPFAELLERHIVRQDDGHWIYSLYKARRMLYRTSPKQDAISPRRYYFEQVFGPTKNARIHAACGRKDCVNPAHARAIEKLTEDDVSMIRTAWRLSQRYKTTTKALGQQYGVSQQSIKRVLNNRTHKAKE